MPSTARLRSHEWLNISVGRVCRACQLTQAKGTFDDKPDCPGDRGEHPSHAIPDKT